MPVLRLAQVGHATAVIAAAGAGERLGAGGPKAFVEVFGRPMLAWSVAAVAATGPIGRLVIAAPLGQEARAGEIAAAAGAGLEIFVVAGAETRAESVMAAVAGRSDEIVVIHDAARPLASANVFDAVIAAVEANRDAAGAIAAAPIADTLKRANGAGPREGVTTVDRRDLWAAQTPQAFRLAALSAAQDAAVRAGTLEQATDEAWLLEQQGATVLLVETEGLNPKITTAEDLGLAEAILRRRKGV